MKFTATLRGKAYELEVENGEVAIIGIGETQPLAPILASPPPAPVPIKHIDPGLAGDIVNSPLPGSVIDIRVVAGQKVVSGELLLVIESMKMENEITAPCDGVVGQVMANAGGAVEAGDPLLSLI